jgi:hypothetical protein
LADHFAAGAAERYAEGAMRMQNSGRVMRRLKPTAVVLAALACGLLATQPSCAQDAVDGALRVKGDATALEVDIRQATVGEVLMALRRFNIRYRSSIVLNDALSGTYAGSLSHVLSRVLDGYNYMIKQSNATLEVIVIGRSGDRAAPAQIIIPVRRKPSD